MSQQARIELLSHFKQTMKAQAGYRPAGTRASTRHLDSGVVHRVELMRISHALPGCRFYGLVAGATTPEVLQYVSSSAIPAFGTVLHHTPGRNLMFYEDDERSRQTLSSAVEALLLWLQDFTEPAAVLAAAVDPSMEAHRWPGGMSWFPILALAAQCGDEVAFQQAADACRAAWARMQDDAAMQKADERLAALRQTLLATR